MSVLEMFKCKVFEAVLTVSQIDADCKNEALRFWTTVSERLKHFLETKLTSDILDPSSWSDETDVDVYLAAQNNIKTKRKYLDVASDETTVGKKIHVKQVVIKNPEPDCDEITVSNNPIVFCDRDRELTTRKHFHVDDKPRAETIIERLESEQGMECKLGDKPVKAHSTGSACGLAEQCLNDCLEERDHGKTNKDKENICNSSSSVCDLTNGLKRHDDGSSDVTIDYMLSNASIEMQQEHMTLSQSDQSAYVKKEVNETSQENSLKENMCLSKLKTTCPMCGKDFANSSNLRVHLRSHRGERPYKCSGCEKAFTTNANRRRHELCHGDERPTFQCPTCEKRFTEKRSMQIHQRCHTGERPHVCSVCGQAFAQLGTLKSHLHRHTGWKGYLCDFCGKSFRQKYHLRLHTLRHKNIRPNACSICSLSFVSKGDLERHKTTHSIGKSFSCDQCDRSFSRKANFKDHMNYHTGQKPYKCGLCDKAFSDRSSYSKHKKLHEDVYVKQPKTEFLVQYPESDSSVGDAIVVTEIHQTEPIIEFSNDAAFQITLSSDGTTTSQNIYIT